MVRALGIASSVLVATSAVLTSAKTVPFGNAEHPLLSRDVLKRSLTGNGNDLNGQTYDYVIVGGGLAGLTVAGRLSENPDVTVAVIEAGADGYSDNNKFVVPAANLYDSAVGTQYDWQWQTVAQPGLGGRQAPWPRGKVLGGSSAINGLYYVRHSEIEQNAWASINGESPDSTWGWDNMLRAMKKSEAFSPPTQDALDVVNIQYNADSHGTDGPIHVSWPGRMYEAVGAFVQSVASLGTPENPDPYGGRSWGGFVATSNINPSNWTRSFSRTGYLDPNSARENLDVLTGHTVTKVLFDSASESGNVRATGVQYSAASGSDLLTVNARREVILSGGAVNDPQILQLSGIGEAALLNQYNIPVVVDLPGVGQHVQDHVASNVIFNNAGTSEIAPNRVTGDAVTDSYVNSAIAYVSSSTLLGDYAEELHQQLRDQQAETVAALNAPDAVKSGYNLTYSTQVNDIFSTDIGPVELLFAISFGSIQVQAALQHPLSRGSIKITSADPFAAPAIDAGYLANEADLITLREGFKLARRVGTSGALDAHTGDETVPGSAVSTDAQWDEWIRGNVGTEYHPSCSCAMLPRDNGGVVDTNLRVYGTQNLRVIDAAVPPFSLSAHLMAATYGIAEIGAELVLQDLQAPNPPNTADDNSSSNTGSGANQDSSDNSSNSGSGSGSANQGSQNNTSAAASLKPAFTLLGAVLVASLLF